MRKILTGPVNSEGEKRLECYLWNCNCDLNSVQHAQAGYPAPVTSTLCQEESHHDMQPFELGPLELMKEQSLSFLGSNAPNYVQPQIHSPDPPRRMPCIDSTTPPGHVCPVLPIILCQRKLSRVPLPGCSIATHITHPTATEAPVAVPPQMLAPWPFICAANFNDKTQNTFYVAYNEDDYRLTRAAKMKSIEDSDFWQGNGE
ncbi:hypothetical protein H920_01522 [Fukomys damarensis]|uniref:Uncharacterized protein n=1 Tax=Fukomys damarensis TaxID=885580 RepID=A0A091EN30_FUKDA|nr:hypothetical protein H920_01522 [Fukomys damarensis]